MAESDQDKLFEYEEVVLTIEVPTTVCGGLAEVASALKRVANPQQMQLFWVPATVTHIAVLHTGRVREDLVSVLIDAWRPVLAAAEPFSLTARGLKLYEEGESRPEGESVRAIWARLDISEPLDELRDKLVGALADLDVDVDTEAFEPHIPIALADSFRNSREFSSIYVEQQETEFGEIPVSSMSVKVANPVEGTIDSPFTLKSSLPLGSEEKVPDGT
jgi:2'-5' RNA ligase